MGRLRAAEDVRPYHRYTFRHFGEVKCEGEVEGLREEACAEPEVPGQVPKKERKRKMKKSTKSLVWDIVKAAAAAIIGVVSAYLTGCTTISFPADDTRPTSFNGITSASIKVTVEAGEAPDLNIWIDFTLRKE